MFNQEALEFPIIPWEDFVASSVLCGLSVTMIMKNQTPVFFKGPFKHGTVASSQVIPSA